MPKEGLQQNRKDLKENNEAGKAKKGDSLNNKGYINPGKIRDDYNRGIQQRRDRDYESISDKKEQNDEQALKEKNEADVEAKRKEIQNEDNDKGDSKDDVQTKVKKARTIRLIIRAIFLNDWSAVMKLANENRALAVLTISVMVLLTIAVAIFIAFITLNIACDQSMIRVGSWANSLFTNKPDYCSMIK